jgi:lipopolysaccharide exporter
VEWYELKNMATASSQYFANGLFARLWNLRNKFPFAKSVAVLSGGAAAGHLFTLAAAPVFTRLYSPSDIGRLGLFNAFLNVASVAASLQYEVAIVSASNEKDAAHLAGLSTVLLVPISMAGGILLYTFSHFSLAGFGILPAYAAWLMIPAIACVALFEILRYWSLRTESFSVISKAVAFRNGGRTISQIILGALGTHSAGLLAGEVLGRCIGMSQMLRMTWRAVRKYPLTNSDALKVLREHRRFPLYFFPSSLINQVGTSVTLPLLVVLYGAATGGYYSLVSRLLALPVVLIGTSMADAFHSRAALLAREDTKSVLRLFHHTTASLLAIGIIPALILFIYGEPLFGLIFGGQWRLSGSISSTVAPWFLASFVVSPVTRLVYVLQGQRFKLLYDLLVLIGNLTVFALARTSGWPMLRTIATLSAMNTGSILLYYLVLLRIAINSTRKSAAEPLAE